MRVFQFLLLCKVMKSLQDKQKCSTNIELFLSDIKIKIIRKEMIQLPTRSGGTSVLIQAQGRTTHMSMPLPSSLVEKLCLCVACGNSR